MSRVHAGYAPGVVTHWQTYAGAAVLVSLVACGPPWTELRRSDPPALAGERELGVRFDLGAARVHRAPEREWLAGLPAARREDYLAARRAMLRTYGRALRAELARDGIRVVRDRGDRRVTLTLVVERIDLRMTSRLVAVASFVRDGDETDRIRVETTARPGPTTPRIEDRLVACAELAARRTAAFVRSAR